MDEHNIEDTIEVHFDDAGNAYFKKGDKLEKVSSKKKTIDLEDVGSVSISTEEETAVRPRSRAGLGFALIFVILVFTIAINLIMGTAAFFFYRDTVMPVEINRPPHINITYNEDSSHIRVLTQSRISNAVTIRTVRGSNVTVGGSGIFVDTVQYNGGLRGLIITNAHVIGEYDPDTGAFTLPSNRRIYVAFEGTGHYINSRLEGFCDIHDVAVLMTNSTIPNNLAATLSGEGAAQLSWADSDGFAMGQRFLSLGNPIGAGIVASEGIIGNPHVLSRTLRGDYVPQIQVTGMMLPGMSGGPVFDMGGNILGINVTKHSETDTIGFLVPAPVVRAIYEDIIAGRVSPRGQVTGRIPVRVMARYHRMGRNHTTITLVNGFVRLRVEYTVNADNTGFRRALFVDDVPYLGFVGEPLSIGDEITQIGTLTITSDTSLTAIIAELLRFGDARPSDSTWTGVTLQINNARMESYRRGR